MKKIIIISLAAVMAGCSAAASNQSSAQESVQESIQTEEPVVITLETALKYMENKDYAKAIESFSALISEDSGRAEYYVGRARAYAASGTDTETLSAAAEDFRSALALDDQITEAYTGLADVLFSMDDTAGAMVVLADGIALTSETADVQPLQDRLAEIKQDAGMVDGGEILSAENLQMSGLSYYYTPGDTDGVADVKGKIHLFFLVTGPENVSDVVVSLFADELPPDYISLAENNVCAFDDYAPEENTVPFYCVADMHAVEDYSGQTVQVVLVGMDKDGNVVGHALIAVPSP
ncbi:MAG: hypothetical protein K6G61_03685 [Solobacterium sp.]|nr:hypothetical protein [Solobacterium sp.]